MTTILDQKQITQPSTIVYDFEEWSVSFNKECKKKQIFYFQIELSDIMCINFPSVSHNLAYAHDAKILLQVYWNIMKQENIQFEFKEEMMNTFTDEGDHFLNIIEKEINIYYFA